MVVGPVAGLPFVVALVVALTAAGGVEVQAVVEAEPSVEAGCGGDGAVVAGA